MPIGKPCRYPRCHHIIESGQYCTEHKSEEKTHGFDRKSKERNPLYNTMAWRKLRLYKLSVNPICEKCKRAAASTVHHRLQAREHPDKALDMENLESVCTSCHNKESQREANDSRKRA